MFSQCTPCTPGLCSCCSQLGEGQLLTLGPVSPGCFQECSVHLWGTVTDSTKYGFLGTHFWPEHPEAAPLKHPGGFRRGHLCLCSSVDFVAALFLPLSCSKGELQPCLVL